jgi:hypothetical protein
LTPSSRPELAFASHQCAIFSQNPKRVHEIAVRKSGIYLQGTRDKGYFLNSNNAKNLDCYVDADFAGLWNPDEAEDPTTLKSRTGYVIAFCGYTHGPIGMIAWPQKAHTKFVTQHEWPGLATKLPQSNNVHVQNQGGGRKVTCYSMDVERRVISFTGGGSTHHSGTTVKPTVWYPPP